MPVHAGSRARAAVAAPKKQANEEAPKRRNTPILVSLGVLLAIQLVWVAAVIYGAHRVLEYIGGLA
jgi:hypothetical protein